MARRYKLPFVIAMVVCAAVLYARGVAVYPGAAEPEWAEQVRQQAAAQGGMQTDAGMRDVKIYATPDAFEKVYAFYKERGTEVQGGFSSIKPRPGPRGINVQIGAFTFDGAPTLRQSKECVLITRPVFLDTDFQQMKDVTAIEFISKK